MLISVAWQSLKSRKKSVLLTFFSLLISICVLLSVEHIRNEAKESFKRTVSGVDLIVGAPSGQLNLLLYSVFRMGSPTNNIRYSSFKALENNNEVKWAIPISLGDSHRGFRVIGTNQNYFTHFNYGNQKELSLAQGDTFSGVFDVVLGYEVAKKLNYHLGDEIIIAHGIGATSFMHHDQAPFTITGILEPTGTSVDKTVHVSLTAIEAIHLPPAKLHALYKRSQTDSEHKLPSEITQQLIPSSITSIMLGLKSKFSIFTLQREINNNNDDRLMAILPGVALSELWQMLATVENLLLIISALVLVSSLLGLSTMLLAGAHARKSEIAILRVLGAGASTIFLLVFIEAIMLVMLAIMSAFGVIFIFLLLGSDWLSTQYGVFLTSNVFTYSNLILVGIILAAATITSAIPAFSAYKSALHTSLRSH